jgi:pseudouridine-5'-phosphate glycosidase
MSSWTADRIAADCEGGTTVTAVLALAAERGIDLRRR